MRSGMAIVIAAALIAALGVGEAAAYLAPTPDTGGERASAFAPDRGLPGGDYFPNRDTDYIIVTLTGNDYREYTAGDPIVFPHGFYMKYPCFNADGTRLAVVARTKVDGVAGQYEIWVMDYDAATQTISNAVQLTSSANGIMDTMDPEYTEIYENSQISWSLTDPDLLLYNEVHKTTANVLKTYDFGTSAFATVYDPALDTNGHDITNPAFLGADDTKVVLGSGYQTGNDRIIVFDGTYPSVTISPDDKNLDPSATYDGTLVTYYSTQATYGEGSIYSEDSGGWSVNLDGFGDPSVRTVPGYWAFRSGKADDRILSLRSDLGWGATALALYDSDGYLVSDLLGEGGTDFVWAYANHNWEGPNGEILFRAEEYAHSGFGDNMFLALERPTELWVDDNWTGPGDCGGHAWGYDAHATIQDAVEAAAVDADIHIAAGLYVEQVHITCDLNLLGDGVNDVVVQSPASLADSFVTGSNSNFPVVFIDEAADVHVSGLTVDGANQGNANYRFCGIAFWNGGGTVEDVKVLNVMNSEFSGAQHGVGVYAYNDTGGPYGIALSNVLVDDYQKTAVALSGAGLAVDLDNVRTYGEGFTTVTAQNGIQIGWGAGGTITDCSVADVGYIGDGWCASGVLLYEAAPITIDGACSVTGSQTSLLIQETPCSVSGVTIAGGVGEDTEGISVRDYGYALARSTEGGPLPASPFDFGEALESRASATVVTVDGATLTGVHEVGSYGVAVWALGDDVTTTITDSDIEDWEIGLVSYEDGCAATLDVSGSTVSGNDMGFWSNAAATQPAAGNWWGHVTGPLNATTNVDGLGDEIADGIDYTPWLGAVPGTSPMAWYTNDSIQDAVEAAAAGDEVRVKSGTYPETVSLGTSFNGGAVRAADAERPVVTGGMTFAGGAVGLTVDGLVIRGVGASGSIIRSLGTVTDLTLNNCLIDGEDVAGRLGYSGGQLEGDVTITDCEMTRVLGWALFDSKSGSGGDGAAMDVITFTGNHVHHCNGSIAFRGLSTDKTDAVNVLGNVFENIGGNAGEAGQHWAALEINHAVEATITGNEIDGVVEGEWGEGQALQLWDIDTIDCSGNSITNNFEGIFVYGGYAGSPYGGPYDVPGGSVAYNNISGNAQYGIKVDAACTGGPLDARYNWWGDESGPEIGARGTGDRIIGGVASDPWIGKLGGENIVCDPDPEYLTVADPTKTVDVEYLGGGSGRIYGYSIKFSWDGAIANADPATVTVSEGNLLSDVGGTFFFPRITGANEITVDCALLGGVGVVTPGTMFSVEFTGEHVGVTDVDVTILAIRDNNNDPLSGFYEDDGQLIVDVSNPVVTSVYIENTTLAHTDAFVKNGDGVKVTATVTDDDPAFGRDDIVADLTGFVPGLTVIPDTYDAGLATWTLAGVTCAPPNGVITVTVTATDALGNSADSSDDITADNTLPTPCAGLDAEPGNGKCAVSWTNGADDNWAGVVVRRTAKSEYPLYPSLVADWPNIDAHYPADESTGTGVYNGTGESFDDVVAARDVYYYQAFCYDEARNYGPANPWARDLATNYWLGDVSSGFGVWGADGLVNDNDILKLSDTYGTPLPGGNDAECDVGPTVHPDGHRLGVPIPDAQIQFEDLMVFAMNYGAVAPRVVPFLSEEADAAVLALALTEAVASEDGIATVAIRLEGNCGDVKGVSAEVAYDSSELEFVGARLSDEMLSPLGSVFFWHGDDGEAVQVDAAVLGTGVTLGGSGELVYLDFRTLAASYELEIETADIRGVDNQTLDAELGELKVGDGAPDAFRLVQNTPNPFNPVTTIAYDVPHAVHVTIRVFDVSGRVVATLVDEVVDAGRRAVTWNGTNSFGEPVGSGVYFCTMETSMYSGSKKMLLLK